MKKILTTFLNIFMKPVSTTSREVETASLKFGFLHAAIISFVFAACNFISTVISQIFVKRYDYSVGKRVTKLAFDNFDFLELAGSLFGTLIIVFLFVLALAGIMFVISRILKNKVGFAKTLTIATFAMTPYMVAKLIALITAWFSPIGIAVTAIATTYLVFITLFAFRNTLTVENEDKLTLCFVILVGGVVLILNVATFILGLLGSSILSSIGL